MSITHITSLTQLSDVLKKAGDKLTVIDFHATWCGPCHAIAPKYESLAKEYTNVVFTKCDVDAAAPVAREYSVSDIDQASKCYANVYIPQEWKEGKFVARSISAISEALSFGRWIKALEATIRSHATSGAFAGTGQTLGSSAAPANTAPANAGGGLFGLDPQMQLFLALIGGYLILTFFFSK